MLPFSSILVPTDFEPAASEAFDLALGLATTFGASVQLLHVVDDRGMLMAASEGLVEYDQIVAGMEESAKDKLAEMASAASARGIEVETEVRIGSPGPKMLAAIDEHEPSLVVMGTHGRSGLRRLFLGSVAESIVRQAHCPVLTVKAPEADIDS